MKTLTVYKLHPEVVAPDFATEQSACFDIAFQAHGKFTYKGYSYGNKQFERSLADGTLVINSGDRVLVPTGLILDIPEGHSVRLHPRSGLSYKQGLVLANAEAVIDSDYVEELFVILYNNSLNQITIHNGDRIAQGELVEKLVYDIGITNIRPERKTNRDGGLGSTGVATPPADVVVTFTEDEPLPKRGRGRPKKTS